MKTLFCALVLLASPNAFANDYTKEQAKSVLAVAMPGAELHLACDLQLGREHAAANMAQLIETKLDGGAPATVAYFKSSSAAGSSLTLSIRVYPGESIADLRLKLTEVSKDIGSGFFRIRECF